MARFDPTFSDRSHYPSYFSSNQLRLLSFFFWTIVAFLLFGCFFWGTSWLLLSISVALGFPVQISIDWPVYVILADLMVLIFWVWPLVFGELHWHAGPQNDSISVHLYSQLRNVILLCALILGTSIIAVLLLHFVIPSSFSAVQNPFVALASAMVAGIGLVALTIIARPRHFFSKQYAILRNISRNMRQDQIRSEYSPIGDIVHPMNRLGRWAANFFNIHNQYTLLFAAFVVGGIIIPAWRAFGDPQKDYATVRLHPFDVNLSLPNVAYDIFLVFEKFIPDSITYIGLIFGFFIGLSLFLRRQRYIFSPFTSLDQQSVEAKTPEERRDREHLSSAAHHLTQEFVDQLEQIGALLTTRQVEDLQSPKRLPLTEFITSGAENDFLAAIQSLVDLDDRPTNITGRLLTSLIKLLAVITISGTLRRRDQTTIELEVRLSQRFGNQTSIIVPIVSSHGADELIDDTTAAAVARSAAIRLLLRAGAVSHLASSEESIDAFLDGLAASAAQNWWRAAMSYQRAIHPEEAVRGSFGIGRYHLGVALLKQGELDAGFQNLVQAERAGKPMAEIHYMLAVVLLHKYWNNLDEQETVFHQIIRYGRLAMRHRRIFPEAYHLIGAAYYHRSKLLDRAATRSYTLDQNDALVTNLSAKARKADDQAIAQLILSAEARRAYDQAIAQLYTAVRHYTRSIRRLQGTVAPNPILRDELDRLRRERMTATHHLGDALRSAGFYALAETYYEDVLAAYPNNMRTLVDLAKTLVLSQNWQRADEFLSREVLIFPEGKWSADINLYLAWTYAGGLNERIRARRNRLTHTYVRLLELWFGWLDTLRGAESSEIVPQPRENHLLLGRAVSHLDYALHQRARFIASWRQTAWQGEFIQAFRNIEAQYAAPQVPSKLPAATKPERVARESEKAPAKPEQTAPEFYQTLIQLPSNEGILQYTRQLQAWLAWRLSQNASDSANKLIEGVPVPQFMPDGSAPVYPYAAFQDHYLEWKYLRDEVVALQKTIEDTGRLHGIAHTRKRLQLAVLALDSWKLSSILMRELRAKYEPPHTVSFAARWAHDVYAEISLLAVRLLAEARAYEIAWVVAMCSEYSVAWCMETWIKGWSPTSRDSSNKHEFKFSPYIARYQLATLQAWKAWCADRLEQTDSARARLVVGKHRYIAIDTDAFADILPLMQLGDTPELDAGDAAKAAGEETVKDQLQRARTLIRRSVQQIEHDIQNALTQAPRHPLALWVQAQRTRAALQADQVASELQRLIEVLGPYDPNQSIANWHLVEKKPPLPLPRATSAAVPADNEPPAGITHRATRAKLGSYEWVSGRHQFNNIVNLYAANEQLAAVFADAGDYNLSIQHLMLALTQSPHWDFGADNLMLVLMRYLDQMDRLRDAYAVVATLRASRQVLENNSLSIAKLYQPYLWECIVLTRMRRYAESLAAGEELQRRLNGIFKDFDTAGLGIYTERLRLIHEDDDNLIPLFEYVWNLFNEDATLLGQLSDRNLTFPARLVRMLNWLTGLAGVLPILPLDTPPNELVEQLLRLDVVDPKSTRRAFSKKPSKFDPSTHERAMNIFPQLDINRNIALRFLDFLSEEALALLELQAQLWNNRAYNTIELRLHRNPAAAGEPADLKASPEAPAMLVDKAISALKALLEHQLLSTSQRARLRRELALYLDTKGWISYRMARLARSSERSTEDHLDEAQESIDQALEYDQSSAVIYYHAARVSLMRLERLWPSSLQSKPPTVVTTADSAKNTISGETPRREVPSFDNYLVAVHHYWTHAQMHDHLGRFRSELAWIGLRLAEYREIWIKHLRHMSNSQQ